MVKVKGYSLKEVAAIVGRSKATIVRWIELKKVDVHKKKNAQGHYVFTEADLLKFKAYNESIIQEDWLLRAAQDGSSHAEKVARQSNPGQAGDHQAAGGLHGRTCAPAGKVSL